jgi:hypothetical protein
MAAITVQSICPALSAAGCSLRFCLGRRAGHLLLHLSCNSFDLNARNPLLAPSSTYLFDVNQNFLQRQIKLSFLQPQVLGLKAALPRGVGQSSFRPFFQG